eukprot:6089826-Prymnesium_polylepis.1
MARVTPAQQQSHCASSRRLCVLRALYPRWQAGTSVVLSFPVTRLGNYSTILSSSIFWETAWPQSITCNL